MRISPTFLLPYAAISILLVAAPQAALTQLIMRPVIAPALQIFSPISALTPAQMRSSIATANLSALAGTMPFAVSAIPIVSASGPKTNVTANSAMAALESGGAHVAERIDTGASVETNRQMSEVLFSGSANITDRPAKGSKPELIFLPGGGILRPKTLSGMTVAEAKSLWKQVRAKLSVSPDKGEYKEIPRPSNAQLAELGKKPGFIVSMGMDEGYEVRLESKSLAIYTQKNPNPNWERFITVPIAMRPQQKLNKLKPKPRI